MANQDSAASAINQLEIVPSPLQSFLVELHLKYKPWRDGAVASYIPELAKVDPDLFGICVG